MSSKGDLPKLDKLVVELRNLIKQNEQNEQQIPEQKPDMKDKPQNIYNLPLTEYTNLNNNKIFKVIKKLGDGAESMVFEIQNENEKKNKALRVLCSEQDCNREYHLNQNMTSFRIIKYYDLYKFEINHNKKIITVYGVSMDLCSGTLLEDISNNQLKKLSELEILKIALDLILILVELFYNKVLHQDIKPENILKYENKYLIGDIGFSEKIQGPIQFNESGSYGYYPNELLKDERKKENENFQVRLIGKIPFLADYVETMMSYERDLFSMGITLYQLFEKLDHNSSIYQTVSQFVLENMISRRKDRIKTKEILKKFIQLIPRIEGIQQKIEECLQISYKLELSFNIILIGYDEDNIISETIKQKNLLIHSQIEKKIKYFHGRSDPQYQTLCLLRNCLLLFWIYEIPNITYTIQFHNIDQSDDNPAFDDKDYKKKISLILSGNFIFQESNESYFLTFKCEDQLISKLFKLFEKFPDRMKNQLIDLREQQHQQSYSLNSQHEIQQEQDLSLQMEQRIEQQEQQEQQQQYRQQLEIEYSQLQQQSQVNSEQDSNSQKIGVFKAIIIFIQFILSLAKNIIIFCEFVVKTIDSRSEIVRIIANSIMQIKQVVIKS